LWPPTTVLRFVRCVPTSTTPVHVVTDAGDAFLKGLGNPRGPHVLACELVGTRLAQALGVPVLDFAVLDVDPEDDLPLPNGKRILPGPAFVTRKEEGTVWGGGDDELKRLQSRGDLAGLVVFDTWVLNVDRCPPQGIGRRQNLDNVYLSTEGVKRGKLKVKAIDHGDCFALGRDLTPRIAHIDRCKDDRVFGLFPAFRSRLRRDDVEGVLERLKALKRSTIEAAVAEIPAEWEVERPARDALVELLVGRQQHVRTYLIDRIWSTT